MTDYTKLASEIGTLVTSKQKQYGDSVSKSGRILEILYPEGVQPHQYTDALLVVRILDKLSRIAQRGPDGQDLGGESPYRDIAGYGLLGASKDGSPVVESDNKWEDFVLPDWAHWKECGADEMSLRTGSGNELALVSGMGGRVHYWVIVAPGAPTMHGAVDNWDEAMDVVCKEIKWLEWGADRSAASKDGASVVEDAAEPYPVETIADKGQHWDSLYNGFRRGGYGQVDAARKADEACRLVTFSVDS